MALVALDGRTGRVRWQTPRNQGRGFSTPRLVTTPEGQTQLVLNGPLGVWAYDLRSGREVWHCERKDKQDMARFGEPMPVTDGKLLVAASGRPGPMQAIRLGGSGDVTRTRVAWEVVRKGHRDVSSPVLWGNYLYSADNKGMLTCYELKTGKVLYNERLGAGKSLASPVVVRGKLLFMLDDGEAVVVEPGPALKVAARNRLGDGGQLDFVASPAVADGKLFLRSQSHLYCIAEKK
jgi:outer membrane protein assembly factor BamB